MIGLTAQGPLPAGRVLVERLDPELPLVLFPVRLATRFHRGDGPHKPPTELWVRIFPDAIHADAHQAALTPTERAIGRAYWRRLGKVGTDQAERDSAHSWLVSQLGAPRAAWVAARTDPADSSQEDAERGSGGGRRVAGPPIDPGDPGVPKEPPSPSPSGATLARLLPDRWYVRISQRNEFVREVWSEPVRRDLAMAPNVADLPEGGGIRDLLRAQGLWWMVDFDEAVEAGMAVKVPLGAGTRELITDLVVFGVRDDDPTAAAELAGLLDAHRFTAGLEVVTHGTPTNATATVDAGYTDVPADLEAYLIRQRLAEPVSRPELARPAALGTASAADALALTFGLPAATAFDAAEHAEDRTGKRAAAMNRALWPATWGHLFTAMLSTAGAPLLPGEDLTWLRSWFRDWVRGPGPLPMFRVGEQPYGVLPVSVLPYNGLFPPTRIGRLRSILDTVRRDWSQSAAAVPNFSEPYVRTAEEEAVAVAAVLGAVPHPTGLRLRQALSGYDSYAAQYRDGLVELERLLGQTNYLLSGQEYEQERKDLIHNGSISEQSYNLAGLRDIAEDMITTHPSLADEMAAVRDHIDDVLWLGAVERHNVRSETRRLSPRFSDATLPDAADPALWYVEYGDDGASADGTFARLRLVPDGAPATVAQTLRTLAADARAVTASGRPGYNRSSGSLLEALLEHGIEQVHPDHAEEIALGLDELAELCETGKTADPLGELALLLRETLGLSTHRLDAWMTSVATHRLAALRAGRPTGVQIGGYGWLVFLTPDPAGPDTQGFVHAPSLDHAATAAVLRSAWLSTSDSSATSATSDSSASAAFGVDLSSQRVRRAEWLLEGMRNGVGLAELLGARFERRLHDGELDHLIADIREAVLTEAGHPGRPANAIVDGLALAAAYRGEPASLLRQRVDAIRAELPGYPGDALLPVLLETTADLDATADALMAQSVHSLVKGNLAEAAAALAASGSGDTGIPELRMARVHRESQNVSHRVVAVFGADARDTPAAPGLLATAEPALVAWLAAVLPDLDQVRLPGLTSTVGGLGLRPAEVVTLAAAGGQLRGSRLGALLSALSGSSIVDGFADGDAQPAGQAVSLDELAIVAGALRSAIGQARAVRGEDLALATGPTPSVDLADLDRRRLALADRLDELAAATPDEATLRSRVADLAAVDDAGTLGALKADAHSRGARVAAVLATAADRARMLRAALPQGWDAWSEPARVEHLAGRINRALALKLPVLTRFTPGNGTELAASAALSDQRLESSTTAAAWLLQVGRVHPGVGRVDEALGLLAAVRSGPVGTAQVAQLPHIPEEPWAALARPVSRGGRTCVLCLTDLVAALEAGPVSGLLFDSWTEPIPGRTATTGVAVHFDSPGAQPPQAVLVATAEPGEAWTVDTLRTLVAQTLELAQIRAVGPETLVPWGHSLPAVFLPEGQTVETLEQEGVPGPIDLPGPDLPGPIDLPGSIGLPGRRRSAGQKGRARR